MRGSKIIMWVGVVMGLAAAAQAAYVTNIVVVLPAAYLNPVNYCFYDGDFRLVASDGVSPLYKSSDAGDVKVDFHENFEYDLRNLTISMTDASTLIADLSTPVGNPTHAKATFTSGAVLTLEGTIEEKDGPLSWTGTLLEVTFVQDGFIAEEDNVVLNTIKSVQEVHITGGELLTGAETGLMIYDPTDFTSVFTLSSCVQPGNPGNAVEDFQSKIIYGFGSRIQLDTTVPEPTCVVLLGLGSLLISKRRRVV
ncbi:MAG: PEP-CTERM sorting domain-containing protein [Sedimentisphaerales bacterium]|nr:PEP-CTERM sorting domain-containing protein [Sedimentisphaerales bacterium]